MYETARLGVNRAAMAANGSAPTVAAPPCIDPASIHSILLSLTHLSRHTSHNDQHLFPLTLRMPAKSSAKLGEVKRHRGEECTGGGAKYSVSVVRCRLERPAYTRRPRRATADPMRNATRTVWRALLVSASTPAGAEPSDGCGDRRCDQQSR